VADLRKENPELASLSKTINNRGKATRSKPCWLVVHGTTVDTCGTSNPELLALMAAPGAEMATTLRAAELYDTTRPTPARVHYLPDLDR